jgi:hypothetical protein
MLSASAIVRLLIEDEEPAAQPPPGDPNPPAAPSPDDLIDPRRDIDRMLDQKPFAIPGTGETHVYQRMRGQFEGRYHRDPNRLKLVGRGNSHTSIIRYPDRFAIRYHDTDVVTAYPDGTVVVDSGGWRPGGEYENSGWTMPTGTHTMIRINEWLDAGWQIYRLPIRRNQRQRGEGGNWYWYNRQQKGQWAYTDGDKILPNGSLLPQRYPESDEFEPVKYEPPQ